MRFHEWALPFVALAVVSCGENSLVLGGLPSSLSPGASATSTPAGTVPGTSTTWPTAPASPVRPIRVRDANYPGDALVELPDSAHLDRIGVAFAKPDGTMDGHFDLTLNLQAPARIKGINLFQVDSGGKHIGTPWSSWDAPNYLLGVISPNQANIEEYPSSLGDFPPGVTNFELFGNGYYDTFGTGHHFAADVLFDDGTVRTVVTRP